MTVAHQRQTTRRGAVRSTPASQLDLFAMAGPAPQRAIPPTVQMSEIVQEKVRVAVRESKASPATAPASISRDKTSAKSDIRIVTVDDMPVYTELDREVVERSLLALPAAKVWFTYAAVQESFGISRATVARRVKEGLVPGIRFRGTNVLEDGAVRRFDRGQLLWLLLAVRSRKSAAPN